MRRPAGLGPGPARETVPVGGPQGRGRLPHRGPATATPLARAAGVQTYQAGAWIFEEDEPGDALFVIVRGRVERVRDDRVLQRAVEEGGAAGETSVLDGRPRDASARATERPSCLRENARSSTRCCERGPMSAEVVRMLSRRLREAIASCRPPIEE